MTDNATAFTDSYSTAEFSTINTDIDLHGSEQLKFIIVPLAVIVTIMLLSIMVYFMARRRKLENLRHRLMPLYNFDKTERESYWETECLNTVDNPNYNTGYQTTKFNS